MNPIIILFLVAGIAGVIAGMILANLGIFVFGFLFIALADVLLYVFESQKS